MDKAFCQPSVVMRNSFVQYLRCLVPKNEAISKWHHFFGSAVAVYPPKSGHPSAEASYFDFERHFLVVTAMQVQIESHKWFSTASYGVLSMNEDN